MAQTNTLIFDTNLRLIGGCLDSLKVGTNIFFSQLGASPPAPIDWVIALPELVNGESMFVNKGTKLDSFRVPLPKLTNGLNMFYGQLLQADNINEILRSLPVVSNTPAITFTGCPGAPTCDPSIGTNKGWTVQV